MLCSVNRDCFSVRNNPSTDAESGKEVTHYAVCIVAVHTSTILLLLYTGFSFQSEGMTTLTNRSRVYHYAALRTYLSQAHTCTSVHVPHFTTNNEVNRTKLPLSLSGPLSSDAIFITCHVQLYVPGTVYRRILEILKKAESSLIDYSYMV